MFYTLSAVLLVVLAGILVAVFLLARRKKRSQRSRRHIHVPVGELSQIRSGIVGRHQFDRQLELRNTEGRFSRRECAMLRFRFHTDSTGVNEAMVDLLMLHLSNWDISSEFCLTKMSDDGFAVLVEDLSLPDDVEALEDKLRMHLELPWAGSEKKSSEFVLASASFPYDADSPYDLWGAVAKRLAAREEMYTRNTSGRPSIKILDNGVALVDHGRAGGMSYKGFREAFQVYQDEIAPDFPGVKFPHLGISTGKILDSDDKAARFMSSKMMVEATSAVAVVPKSAIEKHVVRMFSYYNPPPYPFRVFDDEEAAIAWLSNYVDPLYWEMKEQQQSA